MKSGKLRAQGQVMFNSSLDNFSLKLYSRHNAGGAEDNRYGGMGLAFAHDSLDVKEEVYHNVHKSIKTIKLAKSIPDNKYVGLRYDCTLKMPEKKFTIEGFIDYDLSNNWTRVCNVDYTSSAPGVNDKLEELYCWFRLNGPAKDIGLKSLRYAKLA